ncbi:MAG: LysR family transcriptional regulator [Boseongicola sp.]|nr:MAG: LysR family transcriptional regulator [Boseongicola sp.]
MKNAQMDWDDLRFVLAVEDQGSVAGAARYLGVNHATVLRRIASFETKHKVRLFDKTARGYRLSADRRELIEAIRTAGKSLQQVGRLIDAEKSLSPGRLRITSTDTFCSRILPPIVQDLQANDGQPIELISANAYVDVSRLQADIAVRPTDQLPDDLHGLAAGKLAFAVYGSPEGRDAWLGFAGPLQRSKAAAWFRDRLSGAAPEVSADSFLTLAAMVAEGAGRAVLPVFVGNTWKGLIKLEAPKSLPSVPLWVACHKDLVGSGRIKGPRSFLTERLRALGPILAP